ncbi:LPS export ABC transporter periplasmic protein LptC [Rhabdaerophilum calidifontis]|jgi:lipopolysaccharide export system protein LptC|uniref:LPS export ABC transporter periplasmic protein LptC n=1 Tax=Rhabdaerophilum calidifontis TaxID=2604328 RepID=UPI00123A93C9|nr:LPS export ABC transporter periplasmic protein LptC [Rhabdaerophilum calidifontis]
MARSDLEIGAGPERAMQAPHPRAPARPGARHAIEATLPPHLRGNPAFIAAARHSRRVRFLKRAIPLGTALVLVALLGKSFVGFLGGLDAEIADVSIQGSKIVMDKPKLSGFKRDGRSYELVAATAVQDLKTPNVVDLNRLTARMQTGNDGWADLTGLRGLYDSKDERLAVEGGVGVKTETGVDARLADARIDFKSGTILTDNPVEVRMTQGQVNSDRLQVLDNGRRLVFEGRVRSNFVNAAPPGGDAAPQ